MSQAMKLRSHTFTALHRKCLTARTPLRRTVWIPLLIQLSLSTGLMFAEVREEMNPREQRIEQLIEEFSHRLGITQQVVVSMVPGDTLLASVRPTSANAEVFEISFDPQFIQTLDDREMTAAVAHEFGHIWIYTHFPYLQTEALANQQALKLVSRDDLDRVYEKVWKWKGKKVNPEKVFGLLEDAGGVRDIR